MTAQHTSASTSGPASPQRATARDLQDVRHLEAAHTAERATRLGEAVEVLQILNSLDRVERTALRLIYWADLTHEHVARELAVLEATIRQCVAHGMHELAARLTAGRA